MRWKFFSIALASVIGSLFPIGGAVFANGIGDTTTHYVDQSLHPNAAMRDAIVAGTFDENFPASQPNFITDQLTEKAEQYKQLWGSLRQKTIPLGVTLRRGTTGERIIALRQRLGLESNNIFDDQLAQRIQDYRKWHGLPAGSQADSQLINSLNLGFAYYLRKIELNIQRASELPSNLGQRFVLVDSAEQRLYMYEGDTIAGTMRIIVGKSSDPTPMLAGYIRYAVVNPYWNVPSDLTRDTYAERVIRGGKSYLDTRGFEALSGWNEDARILSYNEVNWRDVASGKRTLRLRQRPGPGNGMGKIKLMFPNKFGVYLHDTPSRGLFSKKQRTLSAGCVRLERAWVLAQWLYGQRPKTNGKAPEQSVALEQPVPVYLTYFTAVPTTDGLAFRDDVYRRDERLIAANSEQS